jgi:hypothetical protein
MAAGIQQPSMRLRFRAFLIFYLIASVTGSLVAQTVAPRDSAQSIAGWVTSIERRRTQLRPTVLYLPSPSSEGSQVALFRFGTAVRKVTALYYGESGKATECYYVLDDQPRFFVRTESRYTRPLSGKIRSQTTERVWLGPDSAFRWQDTTGRTRHSRAALAQKGEEVRRGFESLLGATHAGFASQDRMPDVRCS